jgi:hypothetical protein
MQVCLFLCWAGSVSLTRFGNWKLCVHLAWSSVKCAWCSLLGDLSFTSNHNTKNVMMGGMKFRHAVFFLFFFLLLLFTVSICFSLCWRLEVTSEPILRRVERLERFETNTTSIDILVSSFFVFLSFVLYCLVFGSDFELFAWPKLIDYQFSGHWNALRFFDARALCSQARQLPHLGGHGQVHSLLGPCQLREFVHHVRTIRIEHWLEYCEL